MAPAIWFVVAIVALVVVHTWLDYWHKKIAKVEKEIAVLRDRLNKRGPGLSEQEVRSIAQHEVVKGEVLDAARRTR